MSMPASPHGVLCLNGGSSSIKFAYYRAGGARLECLLQGKIERIGQVDARLGFRRPADAQPMEQSISAGDQTAAVASLMDWLAAQHEIAAVGMEAAGHRIVHGMHERQPQQVTPALLDTLRSIQDVDPEHLPGEIALLDAFARRYPALPQVACFDTAFHADMPSVATLLPIPRRYHALGVQRYGFHGLSYAYLMEELQRVAGPAAAHGRVVLAHLGNGASMAAVRDGRSIDTSMGFTPTSGLVMGTRSGDLDPGVAPYLERTEGLTGAQFHAMVNHASGLLGVSETSADMRDLLGRAAGDSRAEEAIALYCYQAKKCVGAYAAALGGLDTLVFSGGVGEHAASVRARICDGLDFLGITLDAARNAAHAAVVSTDTSRVTVRVIATDEEQMIARSVCRVLGLGSGY